MLSERKVQECTFSTDKMLHSVISILMNEKETDMDAKT